MRVSWASHNSLLTLILKVLLSITDTDYHFTTEFFVGALNMNFIKTTSNIFMALFEAFIASVWALHLGLLNAFLAEG